MGFTDSSELSREVGLIDECTISSGCLKLSTLLCGTVLTAHTYRIRLEVFMSVMSVSVMFLYHFTCFNGVGPSNLRDRCEEIGSSGIRKQEMTLQSGNTYSRTRRDRVVKMNV